MKKPSNLLDFQPVCKNNSNLACSRASAVVALSILDSKCLSSDFVLVSAFFFGNFGDDEFDEDEVCTLAAG